MSRAMRVLCLVGMGIVGVAGAEEKHARASKAATNTGFEKMKSLVGTWVVADKDGKPTEDVVSVIRLTAGGTVLHETLFPGQDHEMVSVYTTDGPDILMTHYCVLGNQPQLKAKATSDGKKIQFDFVGGANLDPSKDKHMHSSVLTIVDDDHIETQGVGWEEGKPAKEMCGHLKLVRKK